MSTAAKNKYEILYQAAPQWVVGWSMDNANLITPTNADDHYPEDYAGKIIAVKPAGHNWGGEQFASCMRLLSIELTGNELQEVRAKNVKVLSGELVRVEFIDHYGLRITNGLAALYGSLDEVETAYNSDNEKITLELQERIAVIKEALPKTVTHTGTGLYAVKKSISSSGDTITNIASQVIALTTGGLGTADAYRGGYVTNTTRSESRSIVSHTDNTITLEGSLANWLATDSVTVYDSWSTIAGAEAALWADQGSTTFTAEQEINIGAGTWIETLTANDSLNATTRYALHYVGDNRLTIIDAGGTLTRHIHAGNTLNNKFSGLSFTGTSVGNYMIERISTSLYNLFENCFFDGDSAIHRMSYLVNSWFRDCEIDGSNGLNYIESYGEHIQELTRCCIHDIFYVAYYPSRGILIEACEIYNCPEIIRSASYNTGAGLHLFRNNTVYNCGALSKSAAAHRNFEMINNIFHTITATLFWESSSENKYDFGAEGVRIDNNTYYNITKYLESAEGDITTFSAWQARNAALGNEANSFERDPLMTDPANADFSLTAGSNEWHAGAGNNASGINNVAFDAHYPDRGAHSSGVVSDAPPSRPTLALVSLTDNQITVTVTGDDGATEHAELIDATGTVVETEYRTGDGNIVLTAPSMASRYKIIAHAENTTGRSKPSVPVELTLTESSNPVELIRVELTSLLKTHVALSSLLGQDAEGNTPIYTAGSATPITTPSITYSLHSMPSSSLSNSGRYELSVELQAHAKTTSTAETLTSYIDECLSTWRDVLTGWSVKRTKRIKEDAEISIASGLKTHSVTWLLTVDKNTDS